MVVQSTWPGPPAHRGAGEIPEDTGEGYRVRIAAGDGSPVRLHTPVQYLDVAVEAGDGWESTVPPDHRGFVYVLVGEGQFGPGGDVCLRPGQLLLVDEGESARVRTGGAGPLRFVLVTGRPQGEPIRIAARWDAPRPGVPAGRAGEPLVVLAEQPGAPAKPPRTMRLSTSPSCSRTGRDWPRSCGAWPNGGGRWKGSPTTP